MKIVIKTGTSGGDTVEIVTDNKTITLTTSQADELAINIALVTAQARKGNEYEEVIEV
ncbi:hypothetical protein [Microvirga tunisiensis]|uniref:hypothetical protein n=1 Tax=Microvirga tunisiensis TaxID=2108360 RepID=UPI00129C4ECD|nr:hypothetical protein [Microvirga tunisiensis]